MKRRMWQAFWPFWLTPAPSTALWMVRLGTALVALVQLTMLWPHLRSLYGNFGWIQWVVFDAGRDDWAPGLGPLGLAAHRIGVDADTTMYAVFVVYGLSLLGLLSGRWPRLWALVALTTHCATSGSGHLSLYGVDNLLQVAFFYLALVPSAGPPWPTSAARSSRQVTVAARIGTRLLQLHLCLIYFNAGLAKAAGDQWWTGEAMWRTLMHPHFSTVDASWLADYPWVLTLGCWATLLLECLYPVAIWIGRVRAAWLIGTVAMHLAIGVLMGLGLFSALMIAFNLSLFGTELNLPSFIDQGTGEKRGKQFS